jgi:hypothetical membrane protein
VAKPNHTQSAEGISNQASAAIARQSIHLNLALMIGAFIGVLFYIYAYLLNGVNPVPILGNISLTRPAIWAAAVIIFVMFWIVFNRSGDKLISPNRFGLIYNSTILSLATTIMGVALLALFVVAMDNAFKGLLFDIVTASLIVAGAITTITYLVIRFAAGITVQRIYTMLIVIMFGGILASAILVSTPDWYDVYLSALGMASAGPVAHLFNASLIFAGIMLIAMANVLFRSVRDFYVGNPQVGKVRFEILYILFVLSGIFLAGIGLFPFVEGTTQGSIHMASAGLLGVVFVLWMWCLRWLIPFFELSFYSFSVFMGVGIAVIYVMATLQIYFNTTGLELTVFVMSTAWLSLFLTNMFNATLQETHPLPDTVAATEAK